MRRSCLQCLDLNRAVETNILHDHVGVLLQSFQSLPHLQARTATPRKPCLELSVEASGQYWDLDGLHFAPAGSQAGNMYMRTERGIIGQLRGISGSTQKAC